MPGYQSGVSPVHRLNTLPGAIQWQYQDEKTMQTDMIVGMQFDLKSPNVLLARDNTGETVTLVLQIKPNI